MSYQLYLDDIRSPTNGVNYNLLPGFKRNLYTTGHWEIARSYDAFVAHITTFGLPVRISFDHDLADVRYDPMTRKESLTHHELTGMDCAKWLIEYCLDNDQELPEYYVHSQNPVGAKNIQSLLDNFKNRKK